MTYIPGLLLGALFYGTHCLDLAMREHKSRLFSHRVLCSRQFGYTSCDGIAGFGDPFG
jgi:hypothetical protein